MGMYTCETNAKGPVCEDLKDRPLPRDRSSPEEIRFCAYNQTRKRFLSTVVECGDFSAAILQDRLPFLTPGGGFALWINPFRGISATRVSVPIDLIYLDKDFVVLDAVESFPIFQVADSCTPAASVLALPAETIASTGTRAGDRLAVCTPEELRVRLLEMSAAKADAEKEQSLASGPGAAFRKQEPGRGESIGVPGGEVSIAQCASTADPETMGGAIEMNVGSAQDSRQAAWKRPAVKKNWLQRLLSEEPLDPRSEPREALLWIVAYFFTGGAPKAHSIRDISATGVYLFTEERWYPGTLVRITLTDRRRPTTERSITAYAKVVRWGNDGVGLKFVLKDKKDGRRGQGAAESDPLEAISRVQVEQFLQLVRSGTK